MSTQLHKSETDARKLRAQKVRAKKARIRLFKDGYTENEVHAAMWQAGYRDWHTMSRIGHVRPLSYVLVVVAFVALLLGITMILERQEQLQDAHRTAARVPDEVENDIEFGEERIVTSEPAGISFAVPQTWTLTDASSDEDPDLFSWQLEPERNIAVKQQLKARYGDELGEEELAAAALGLLNDPLTAQLVTLTITVSKEPTHFVEDSLDEWKTRVDETQGRLGFSTEDFRPITINGVEGYEYRATVDLGDIQASTREYAFILEDRRVEVTVFPVQSESRSILDAIIDSLVL